MGVHEVNDGSQKAAESGEALSRILAQINDVTTQINQVTKAAQEQTGATDEISRNMYQITEVVAKTSSGAHETTRAADSLAHVARRAIIDSPAVKRRRPIRSLSPIGRTS